MPDQIDEYKDFDVNAVAAEIGNDLFGGEGRSDPPESPASDLAPSDAETAPESASGESSPPNSTPSEASQSGDGTLPVEPLPKSWKKEMEAEWTKLPASVRAHVLKREEDVYQGIKQYAANSQSYDAITTPFKEIFSQHPDVQPVQLFQNLMHSHVKLLTLPPEEKAAFGRQLLEAYGISPDGSVPQAQNLPPGYQQMQAELAETRRIIRSNQAAAHAAEVARYEAEIKAFASANPLFPEVQDDILRLISTGAAVDVKSAYETAVWANPATRAKMLAEQQASSVAKPPKAKPPMTNIESSGTARINRKPASIDDSVDAVIAKHYSTH
jgi:hypothetical protein